MIVVSIFLLSFLSITPHAQVYTKNWYKGTQCTGSSIQDYYLYPLSISCQVMNNGAQQTSYLASCNNTGIRYTNCSDVTCSSSSCATTVTQLGTCTVNSDGLSSVKHGCMDLNPYAQSHASVVQVTYFSDRLCTQQQNGITFIHTDVCTIEGNRSGYYQCNDSYNVYYTQCQDLKCKQGCNTTRQANYCSNYSYYMCFPPNSSAVATTSASTTNSPPLLLLFAFFFVHSMYILSNIK